MQGYRWVMNINMTYTLEAPTKMKNIKSDMLRSFEPKI